MRATYCPSCDETRWQLTGLRIERATTCASCGGELQTERRTPGRGRLAAKLEERRAAMEDRRRGATPA